MKAEQDKSASPISLELGNGGKLMRDFITGRILPAFGNPLLHDLHDASLLPGNIAFTTDSYVVDPIFFPGGNIGTLAVFGTANDLIVSGAVPKFISLALIIEEGLAWDDLDKILRSIRTAARRAGVRIVTGDTKVVRRGQGDKIYINTSGIGAIIARPALRKIRPGDKILLTGTLGEHSTAVMLARGDFGFFSPARSDCAPLLFLLPLWKHGVLWMRDITRGGLATILSELAEVLPYSLLIDEDQVPLSRPVRAAVEILGIDPLYLACEGRAVCIVSPEKADALLRRVRAHALGKSARIVGEVQTKIGKAGELLLRTTTGGFRRLEPMTSELLPRIC